MKNKIINILEEKLKELNIEYNKNYESILYSEKKDIEIVASIKNLSDVYRKILNL